MTYGECSAWGVDDHQDLTQRMFQILFEHNYREGILHMDVYLVQVLGTLMNAALDFVLRRPGIVIHICFATWLDRKSTASDANVLRVRFHGHKQCA